MLQWMSQNSVVHHLMICLLLILLHFQSSAAQAKTDPSEVAALNTMLGRWGKTAKNSPAVWNISGEPCSGAAIDATSFENQGLNPGIKCDCSYNDGATCHITQLKVYALDIVGTIPEELQNLTYLTNLDLRQNYLTGLLPSFIGNLSKLQYLSVGINALSGRVPKELGKLLNLLSLSISTNNFSGSLPSEIGNITNLQQLYINTCGLNGEFPSAITKLKNLQKMWAIGNNFTGKMPEFNGTSLIDLRLHGNSFEGPIPSTFSTMTNLQSLRIGEIQNGSSSLAFISNLTSLITLILRNCMLTGPLSRDFSAFTKLQILDLSFNNLAGQIPPSLFILSSLNFLFLGNNSLTGSLPSDKSNSLLNVDLSYNQLSGIFPSWVGEQDLKLNLVANNFVLDDSNKSILPSGLNCLQRDKPCNNGSPIYSSFAINCGGNSAITSSDGTVYEIDRKNLTTASYYVTDTNKWAISTVGRFADTSNPNYILDSPSQFSNTLEPELYQTARITPSSLRYYGLGLENGNYTVTLNFAETQILNPPTWKSVGRRIFDIYIQGKLQEKDFDIRKEAGEASFSAVTKQFTAPVTENFLEIHFFWVGKGTCCVPYQGYYGASVSAISLSPDFIPSIPNKRPSTDKGLAVGIPVGVTGFILLLIFGVLVIRRSKRLSNDDDDVLLGMSAGPQIFTYADLRAATENFSPVNKLGEGGFGSVFKGKLSDGRTVAVKQLSVTSKHGKTQFLTEIITISAVQHRNLVELHGCCVEGGKRLLVYEYLENKSIDQALFGENKLHLDWPARFRICLGVARGLSYLHEESRSRIVHRDVKASNILLDAELNPKISDFGLAKLYDDDTKTYISTRIAGTIGYLAPEYALRGHFTEKVDVFSFGVVALEVLSGRLNSDKTLDPEKVYLLEWAWNLRESHIELELVDPTLTSFDEQEAIRVINVAFLCTQTSPFVRPSMSRVAAMLAGDVEVSEVMAKPGYLTDWQFDDLSRSSYSQMSEPGSSNANPFSTLSSMTRQNDDRQRTPLPEEPLVDGFLQQSM